MTESGLEIRVGQCPPKYANLDHPDRILRGQQGVDHPYYGEITLACCDLSKIGNDLPKYIFKGHVDLCMPGLT
jgi:hypothetical protein